MPPVAATFISDTEVSCTSPARDTALGAGDMMVVVSNNGLDFTPSYARFYYRLAPAVASVSPSVAPEFTKVRVSVSGANFFDADGIFCRFARADDGTKDASNAPVDVQALWESPEFVQCATPELQRGTYRVEVSNNGADFSANGVTLEVETPMVVSKVWPMHGLSDGGDFAPFGGNASSEDVGNSRGTFASLRPQHNAMQCRRVTIHFGEHSGGSGSNYGPYGSAVHHISIQGPTEAPTSAPTEAPTAATVPTSTPTERPLSPQVYYQARALPMSLRRSQVRFQPHSHLGPLHFLRRSALRLGQVTSVIQPKNQLLFLR